MKIKTYRTRSLEEAIANIKQDLGAEAMILGTRPVSARSWGIKRQQWEVTAGLPEPKAALPATTNSDSPAERAMAGVPDSVSIGSRGKTAASRPALEPVEPKRAATDEAGPSMSQFDAPSRLIRKAESRIEEVLEEIDDLKRAVRFLGQSIPASPTPEGGEIYAELVGQGVDPDFARKLIASAARLESSPGNAREAVRALLAEMLQVEPPVELAAGKKRMISVFVGPTGVGKTTTIAKIAGQAVARHGRKVALISTDTQRVTGQEQLSRYAQLLDVASFKCSDTAALKDMVMSLDEYDLILVDTAGCSPSDLARLGRLQAGLDGLGARVHLVLSATTKAEDVSKIYKRFQRFSPQSVIFTKLDETDTQGSVVGELMRYLLPVSFMTDGQRVPENLVLPTATGLARLLLPVRLDPPTPKAARPARPATESRPVTA